jgi:hypothetical protein
MDSKKLASEYNGQDVEADGNRKSTEKPMVRQQQKELIKV